MLPSWLDGVWVWGQKTIEAKCRFHHVVWRAHVVGMTCHHRCWPRSPARSSVCRVSLLLQSRAPTFPYCTLGRGVTLHDLPLRTGGYTPPLPRGQSICVNYLEIFCMGHLSPSLVYLRSDISIGSFILFFGLQSKTARFCCSDFSSFGQWEELFPLAPVSLWHSSIFVFNF